MEYISVIQETLQRAVYVLLPFFVCLNVIMLLDKLAPQFGLIEEKKNIKEEAEEDKKN